MKSLKCANFLLILSSLLVFSCKMDQGAATAAKGKFLKPGANPTIESTSNSDLLESSKSLSDAVLTEANILLKVTPPNQDQASIQATLNETPQVVSGYAEDLVLQSNSILDCGISSNLDSCALDANSNLNTL